TEMGRQPWVVVPNPNPSGVDGVWMLTARGVSSTVGAGTVLTSMIAFTLLYAVLAVVWFRLMTRYAAHGVSDHERDPSPLTIGGPPADRGDEDPSEGPDGPARPLSFAY